MKRPYLLAASLLALIALGGTACHRNDRVGTTNTTSATVTPGEPGLQVGHSGPNVGATPAVKTAEPPAVTPADLPNAKSTAATGAANGSSAAQTGAASATAAAPATAPVDISGTTPAATTQSSSTAGAAAADNAALLGNANATSTTTTTGAPLVAPGLDNGVSGGVSNTGAPFNHGMPNESPWFGPAPVTPRPVGGAMRPGAASDPNTTSGAR